MSNTADFDTDVLVVGSGPMGASLSLALATYGIRVHTVTKWNWTANSPRAHITNPRTVEVFRDLGIDEEAAQYATAWDQMGDMVFAESLAGEELARAMLVGRGDDRISDYLTGSPSPFMDLPQLYLEPILVNNAAARGASMAFNTEYLDHVQDADGVTVTLGDRLADREYTVRAKYLVGADGARSKVFEDLGLPLEGELGRAATAYVLFDADLSRYVAHRPGIIHFLVTQEAAYGELGMGMLRAVRPWHSWIAGWGFDPEHGEADFSEDAILEKIRGFVGDPDLDIDVKATSTWYVNEAYAPQFSRGRVFCGGDAVHRHPPSNGLGSNTSIQDAYNLAWKLAYVLNGMADPALLETYSAERAPVGEAVVKRANQSRRDYKVLTDCFRTDGAPDGPATSVQKLRDPSPAGVANRKALRAAIDFKQTEFNCHGVDFNQRYESAAVLPDPGAGQEVFARDREVYLQATTRPGAKFPHMWLVDRSNHKISTLDVVGKGKFSLVTGLSGQAWVHAAEKLSLPFLRTVVIGDPDTADPYQEWSKVSEIAEAGAILVRPDCYVAWRMPVDVFDDDTALSDLRTALSAILGTQIDGAAGPDLEFSTRSYSAT